MKKGIYILLIACLGFSIFSCSDYLDSDYIFKNRKTIEKVFTNRDSTEAFLANAFSYLGDDCADVCNKRITPHCFADDMYYGDDDGDIQESKEGQLSYNEFKEGRYDENTKQGVWQRCYQGIRQASLFLQYIDLNKELAETGELPDYKAQARFVRAYYYWLLLRRYGPVPLLPNEGLDYDASYDDLATPRSSYESVAEYISQEMALAAKDLPLTRGENSAARPTRGAALSTRALALLYAASPLANGNNDEFAQLLVDDKGNRLLSPEYSEEKWAKAAAAAKDVMELRIYKLYTTGIRTTHTPAEPATIAPPEHPVYSHQPFPEGWMDIDPFESYRSVFNGTIDILDNPELIFSRGRNIGGQSIRDMVIHQLPLTATGWNTSGLTQKIVDAYYMNDGANCPGMNSEYANIPEYNNAYRLDSRPRTTGFTTQEDVDAGKYKPLAAGVSLQYANREPRFYASVAYNGAYWYLGNEKEAEDRNKQIFYYRGKRDGYNAGMFWLRTGIGVMKFVHPDDTYLNNDINNLRYKPEPAIRYADILLMYAEAVNEVSDGTYEIPSWDGSKIHSIHRSVEEMKKGMKPVRMRAGIPDFENDIYEDKDVFRIYLKRERQIELMGEGKRYYDLRRWKDARVEEAVPVYGCSTLMTASEPEMFHTPVAIWNLSATFSDKMWFWPISHSELKRNKRMTQTPGWTYND